MGDDLQSNRFRLPKTAEKATTERVIASVAIVLNYALCSVSWFIAVENGDVCAVNCRLPN